MEPRPRVVRGTDLFFGRLSERREGLGPLAGPATSTPPADESAMTHLVKLNLEQVRLNLERASGTPQTHEDVMRLLAGFKVWRRNEDWFTADDAALRQFLDGEVLEKRPAE